MSGGTEAKGGPGSWASMIFWLLIAWVLISSVIASFRTGQLTLGFILPQFGQPEYYHLVGDSPRSDYQRGGDPNADNVPPGFRVYHED